MGAKHSKPRIRRSRRFSSLRKRQAPEGSNDPAPSPNEAWHCGNNNKPGVDETCKYCGSWDRCQNVSREHHTKNMVDDDVIERRMQRDGKKSFFEDFIKQADLKVDVPRSPDCCRRCTAKEKSKSLPPKSSMQNCNKLDDKEEEQEWTITLYEIDKLSGRVPKEDMVRLMSSIYEAVDAKVGESPQGRKTVRVRLSVTPERRSHTRLQRTSSTPHREHSDCRCSSCPNTEPSFRRTSHEQKIQRRHRTDVSPLRRPPSVHATNPPSKKMPESVQNLGLSGENNERRNHYAKLEGLDNNMHLHRKEKDNFRNLDRTKSLPQTRHRPWPKLDDHQALQSQKTSGSAKHRQRHHVGDQRNVMLRTRRKDPRFASPYDQHFQEAMYLRLRELQRQGAVEVRKAKGLQDSDEADDDSDTEVEKLKPNVNHTETSIGCAENNIVSTITNTLETAGLDVSGSDKRDITDSSIVSSVHHHHHYHHGTPGASIAAALNSPDALGVKCITNAANLTCSSIVPKSDNMSSTEHHHHHYHHHYDRADEK